MFILILSFLFLCAFSFFVQDNEIDGSDLDSSNDDEEWNSDSSR